MSTDYYAPLYWFFTGSKSGVQELFCDLIRKALKYKYRNYKNLLIPVPQNSFISNPVFEFGQKDKINLIGNHVVDGKKIREIYISTIFAGFLNGIDSFRNWPIKNKRACLAYVETENTEADTYILLSSNFEIRRGQKMYFLPDSMLLSLQVKECINNEDLYSNISLPYEFEISESKIRKYAYYDNFILIYLRGFFQVDTDKIRETLKANKLEDKNIFLIGMVWDEKIPQAYNFNIFDLKNDELHTVSFKLCKLFKTMSLSKIKN